MEENESWSSYHALLEATPEGENRTEIFFRDRVVKVVWRIENAGIIGNNIT